MTPLLAVSAVVRGDGEVLMVRQRNAGDPHPIWGLPGGMVEDGELSDRAAVREVAEECGLKVGPPTRLLAVVQFPVPATLTALYFAFERPSGPDLVPADPDGDVLEAAWVPVGEAVARLADFPLAVMREPATACLREPSGPVRYWTWPDGPGGRATVV
ncbi:NUDIX hydrolase [Nonomuraea sp. NPDC050790]|uniref:NUDIX hydrolase n=1 Tax=Nonomuraea sp. NPDC050790 TaxID=3364371 RepID=UPI0037AFD54D